MTSSAVFTSGSAGAWLRNILERSEARHFSGCSIGNQQRIECSKIGSLYLEGARPHSSGVVRRARRHCFLLPCFASQPWLRVTWCSVLYKAACVPAKDRTPALNSYTSSLASMRWEQTSAQRVRTPCSRLMRFHAITGQIGQHGASHLRQLARFPILHDILKPIGRTFFVLIALALYVVPALSSNDPMHRCNRARSDVACPSMNMLLRYVIVLVFLCDHMCCGSV